jgi:hypothetical protein
MSLYATIASLRLWTLPTSLLGSPWLVTMFRPTSNRFLIPRTYGMIKPNAYLNIGKIISETEDQFTIANLKMFRFSQN